MRSSFSVFLASAWLIAPVSARAAEFPAFTVHHIDNFGKDVGQTGLADLDKDGDLDWIAGNSSNMGGEICWWEYRGPDEWVRHSLGKGNTDVGGAAFDVNGDGWIDFLSGTRLLLNTGRPRTEPFAGFDVGTTHSHDTEFADVNGDGRMDAIANSDRSGLFWHEIPADPTKPWIKHMIATIQEHKVHGGVSPRAVADLDGDGDNDVATARIWYENLGGGLRWQPHKNIDLGEPHQYGIAVRTWAGDLDGDKDVDLIQAENDNPDGRIAWFENDGKGNWTRHIVREEGQGQDFHSLAVADFDGDGDLDIYSGAGPISASKKLGCYIWENRGGKPIEWVEHLIAEKPCHEAEAADVDGDGDIDICTKPWSGTDEHVFLRNMLAESRGKGPRAEVGVGTTFQIEGKAAWVTRFDVLPLVTNDYSRRFKFESAENPKLKELRDGYRLDEVIAAGRDEFEQQIRLMDWVHNRFQKFGQPSIQARNALEVLRGIEQGETFFCAQYAQLLSSAAASLGWVDRVLALRRHQGVNAKGGSTEHSTTEIWSNQHGKWVMLDPTSNYYAEKNGVPLNAYEIRQEWFYNDGRGLEFVVGKDRRRFKKADLPIHLKHFSGFGDLTLEPDELDKYGFIGYIPNTDLMDSGYDYGRMFITKDQLCDGTAWHKRDLPAQPAVEPYFPLGQAAIELNPVNDELVVTLRTFMPNFKNFESRFGELPWKSSESSFEWPLRTGANQLQARTVNAFGVRGPASTVEIDRLLE